MKYIILSVIALIGTFLVIGTLWLVHSPIPAWAGALLFLQLFFGFINLGQRR